MRVDDANNSENSKKCRATQAHSPPGGGAVEGSRVAGYNDITSRAAVCSAGAYVEPVEGGTLISDPLTDAQAVITFGGRDDDYDSSSARVSVNNITDNYNKMKASASVSSRDKNARKQATVAFRGSSSRADWMGNVWFPLKPLPSPHRQSVKAHSGFLRQYLSIHAHILKELEDNDIGHVVLTGHSLGGALAIIAAAMLPAQMTCDVVTFGGPRPGNEELSDAAYHKCRACVRVVHDRDVVPLMPLQAMGFKHVCEPWLMLDNEGGVHDMPSEMPFWRQCVMRARGAIERDFGVRDHYMVHYLKAVADKFRGGGGSDDANERQRELEMQTMPNDVVKPRSA